MSQLKIFIFVVLLGGLGLGVGGLGCAGECAGNEVCAFSTFGKAGLIEDCVCVKVFHRFFR